MEQEIPVTYVPGRNILFLAHALSWAEVLGASPIFSWASMLWITAATRTAVRNFLQAFATMANLGTKAGSNRFKDFRFHAPLIQLSKKEIILKGMELGVDYSQTHSCYDPVSRARPVADVMPAACGCRDLPRPA